MSEATQTVPAARAPIERLLLLARDYGTTVLVAAVVFAIAVDNGGFGESTRDTLAIVLWWIVILTLALGILPLARATRPALVTGGLLAGLGLFTLLSAFWASGAEGAYLEFTRVALYVSVFFVVVVAGSRQNAARWSNGLALGISGIAVLALASRLFPHLVSNRELVAAFPGDTRLSYPIGYWNGLAVFSAMGLPLLLRVAVAGRGPIVRGLALAPIPVIASVIYLSSSRGGVIVAVAGVVIFFVLTARRWAAASAVVVAALGLTAALWVLLDRDVLANGPLGSAAAESQGRSAALMIVGICVLTALAYGIGCRLFPAEIRLSPKLGWALVLMAVTLAGIGVAAVHPVRRLDEFKQPPGAPSSESSIQRHLISAAGGGRWQLWHSAVDEFESRPLAGTGAGTFEQWWARHGSISIFVVNTHSLYLQTLGELGIVGFVLLVGAFLSGAAAIVVRAFSALGEQRVTLAALGGSFLAYCVAAGIDWMWELTIVSAVAFACLGLATGPANAPAGKPRPLDPAEQRRVRIAGFGPAVAALVGGWLVICAVAVPLLAGVALKESESASANGNLHAALSKAAIARDIEPWASSPYLQLALIDEEDGRPGSALAWIQKAIRRDHNDWSLWVIAARLQTKLGLIDAANRSIDRARLLNPRSPLFTR